MKAKTFEGTVTKFLEHKGIGVVIPSDNSSSGSTRKVRFHISDLDVDSVSEGDELEFGIRKTDDGYEARDPTLSKSTTSSTSSHRSSTNSGRGNTNSSSTKPAKIRGCEGTVATYFQEDGYGFVSTADITRKVTKTNSKQRTCSFTFRISIRIPFRRETGSNSTSWKLMKGRKRSTQRSRNGTILAPTPK